jgi:hypothetical protein
VIVFGPVGVKHGGASPRAEARICVRRPLSDNATPHRGPVLPANSIHSVDEIFVTLCRVVPVYTFLVVQWSSRNPWCRNSSP